MGFLKEEFHFDPAFPFALFETNASQVMIHCHDCLEINYITKGTGHYIIEDKTYSIKEGDFFIINNAEHHMAVHEGNLSMIVFVFDPRFMWENPVEYDYLSPFFQDNSYFTNRISVQHGHYADYRNIFLQIVEEYNGQAVGWQMLIKAFLMLFLGILNRSCQLSPIPDKKQNGTTKSYDKIRPVVEYIHNHFWETITLEELSKVAIMNPSYLSAYFTSVMKLRVFEYIEQVRIFHAKLLLKTTNESVTEIACSCGFNSVSYFNRIFKRVAGTTPSKYRMISKDSAISL